MLIDHYILALTYLFASEPRLSSIGYMNILLTYIKPAVYAEGESWIVQKRWYEVTT